MSQVIGRLSPLRSGFDPRSVRVKYVVDKVALGQVSLPVLRVSLGRLVPPVLHAHLRLNTCRVRRTSRRIVKQSNALWGNVQWWTEKYLVVSRLQKLEWQMSSGST